jgi:tetraacyldisaccharide 4'-kinase
MIRSQGRRIREAFERFEQFAVDVVYDRRQGKREKVFASVLFVFSLLFSLIARVRLFLYEKRILRNQPLGCLVVVVGNLTVGGTGKTPIVEIFARTLNQQGRKVAVLSRGYKSKKEPFYLRWKRAFLHMAPPPPKIVSDGESVLLGVEEAGDEPFMLAHNLPGVAVVVDKNRVKAGAYAIKHLGVDTLILDDGFQYLPLKGRLNLLLIDKTNPFGNGCLLPRGILREPIAHMKRASYIFLTKSDGLPDDELRKLIATHNPQAEIIECAHRPSYLQNFQDDQREPLAFLQNKRVGAFSGIAVPAGFEEFVREGGAEVRYVKRFLDHHRFLPGELETVFAEAEKAGVDFMVTTEKDAVRIPADFKPSLPLYYLRLEVEILDGREDFDQAVGDICFPAQSRNNR